MMNKKYFFALATVTVLGGALIVFASPSNIQYPVEELDNCASETACRVYCDVSANTEACLNFAEKNNLMTTKEIQKARKFKDMGTGPGGCKTDVECETYCDSVEHMDECISFAEKNGLMPAEELEEAKKVQTAKNRGVKMPACGSKKQCDLYCSEASHMEECIIFAREAGLMSPQELEESEKVLAAIKAGATPPPCGGKKECDIYCSQEEHFDACLDFALAAGFMDPKDAEMARKTGGKGPGGCRGEEECDAFCEQEGNMEICGQFAYDNGMVTKEEFEMMKKTKGKGPGGCKSIEECDNFCNNPDNQETCFNFAKENGMISEKEIQQMEEGKQQFNNMQPGDEEHGFAPGTGPDSMGKPPCEGDECQQMPQEYEPGTGPDSMMNKPPCEGDECQQMPPPPPPVEPIEQQPISFTFDLLLGAILMPFVQIFQ
ncbi:hypothetical protein KKA27_04060 [Patescibacteria group bacterium]|nr:hypothetical protein [Patescibacteria group bacterium]MBU2633167.1 hypothetical protein [Patescibacteria group bacterium]